MNVNTVTIESSNSLYVSSFQPNVLFIQLSQQTCQIVVERPKSKRVTCIVQCRIRLVVLDFLHFNFQIIQVKYLQDVFLPVLTLQLSKKNPSCKCERSRVRFLVLRSIVLIERQTKSAFFIFY